MKTSVDHCQLISNT